MSELLIVQPLPIASVVASRGTGAANLAGRDPKEAWIDANVGSAATLTIDLGAVRTIDTIFLGYIRSAAAGATWAISGGVASGAETVIQAAGPLRVPDSAGDFASTSHGLWYGAAIAIRYLVLSVTQPAGSLPLSAGIAVVGRAFVAELGQEWGAGRRPIDTGSATALASGGFAVVEGVRKRNYAWTFGDLSIDEADRLERIALELGETAPGLVVENFARTAGLRWRIHYGLFERWRPFERRNRRQTRWEIGIEEWV